MLLHHLLHISLPSNLLILQSIGSPEVMARVNEIVLLGKSLRNPIIEECLRSFSCCWLHGSIDRVLIRMLDLHRNIATTWYLHLIQLPILPLHILVNTHSKIIVAYSIVLIAYSIRASWWPLMQALLLPLWHITLLWPRSIIHWLLLSYWKLILFLEWFHKWLIELLLLNYVFSYLLRFYWSNKELILLWLIFLLYTLVISKKLCPELGARNCCGINSDFWYHQFLSIFWPSVYSLNPSSAL